MTDNMVERVARALCAEDAKLRDCADDYGTSGSSRNYWQPLARAAIAAMREPTEGMFDNGADAILLSEDDGDDYERRAAEIFRRMIDAALSTGRGG